MIVLPKQARANLPGTAAQRLHWSAAGGLNRGAARQTRETGARLGCGGDSHETA